MDAPKSFVMVARKDRVDKDVGVKLRTYINPSDNPGAKVPEKLDDDPEAGIPAPISQKWPIWQAARATSAAPFYFDSITVDNVAYIDGGIQVNNPSME